VSFLCSGYLSNPKLVASSAACTCGGVAGNVNGNLDSCLVAIRSTGTFCHERQPTDSYKYMQACVQTRLKTNTPKYASIRTRTHMHTCVHMLEVEPCFRQVFLCTCVVLILADFSNSWRACSGEKRHKDLRWIEDQTSAGNYTRNK